MHRQFRQTRHVLLGLGEPVVAAAAVDEPVADLPPEPAERSIHALAGIVGGIVSRWIDGAPATEPTGVTALASYLRLPMFWLRSSDWANRIHHHNIRNKVETFGYHLSDCEGAFAFDSNWENSLRHLYCRVIVDYLAKPPNKRPDFLLCPTWELLWQTQGRHAAVVTGKLYGEFESADHVEYVAEQLGVLPGDIVYPDCME